jgi:hypothetical protein
MILAAGAMWGRELSSGLCWCGAHMRSDPTQYGTLLSGQGAQYGTLLVGYSCYEAIAFRVALSDSGVTSQHRGVLADADEHRF